jgi:hypothetical protein
VSTCSHGNLKGKSCWSPGHYKNMPCGRFGLVTTTTPRCLSSLNLNPLDDQFDGKILARHLSLDISDRLTSCNTILWCRVRLILPSKSTICTSMASELSQPQPRTTLHSPLQQLHVSSLTSFPRLLLHFGIACLRVKPPCAGTRDVCTPLKAPSLLVLWRRNDKCQLHTRFCNLLPTCYIST